MKGAFWRVVATAVAFGAISGMQTAWAPGGWLGNAFYSFACVLIGAAMALPASRGGKP